MVEIWNAQKSIVWANNKKALSNSLMRLSYSIPNHLYLIAYINYMPKPKEKENLCMSRHNPNETRQHAKQKAFNYKFEKESWN